MKRVPILVATVICAVAVVPWLVWWSSLPDPVASHWDIHGHPNGHLPRLGLLVVLGGVACVLAISAAGATHFASSLPRSVSGAPVLGFVAAVLATASAASVVANHDAASWEQADLGSWWILFGLAFGVIVALAVGRMQPRAIHEPPKAVRNAVAFGPTERVVWIGETRVRWVIVVALGLVVLGLFQIVTLSPPTGEIVLASALLVASFSSVHVVADRRGVRCSSSFGWPRVRISLDRIASAEAIDVRPLQWGGWGYRGSLRLFQRAAWILRGGPGLRLDLRDGKVFIVTVDDPEEAAAVVNGLLATPTSTSR